MTRERAAVVDAYRVLGISPGAGPNEITRAYRTLARRWHPDTNPSPDAPDRLARVVDAYRCLIREDAPRAEPPGPPDPDDPRPEPAEAPPRATRYRPRGATVVAGPVRLHGLPPG